jgi:hypothetical protein
VLDTDDGLVVVDVRLVDGSGSAAAFQALLSKLRTAVGVTGLGDPDPGRGSATARPHVFPRLPDPPPLLEDPPAVHLAASVSDEPTMV